MGVPVKYDLSRGFMYQQHSALRKVVRFIFSLYRGLWYPVQLRNKLNLEQINEAKEVFENALVSIEDKYDLYAFSIDGIRIGDLIHDTYLKSTRKERVNIDDKKLHAFLKQGIELYIFWRDISRKKDASAVIVSHTCYLFAIPARVFVFNGKKAFQVNHSGVFQLSKSMLWAYNESHYFKLIAKKIPSEYLAALKTKAKKRLELRFSGKVGVDMVYSTASAYTSVNSNSTRLLAESNNLKVLIAAHCLFDAPNGYGDNLFIDFYDWLKFLSDLSKKVDYDWYIKTHPDFLPGNEERIVEIISGSNIKLLSSSTSHHQIIDEGIDAVLTVYGTIGFEYAALGKTVVNASLSNPHIAYDFNINPKSIEEYRSIILNLRKYLFKPNVEDVYEYYAMKLYTDTSDWFFISWKDISKSCTGGVPLNLTDEIKSFYHLFLNLKTNIKHWKFLRRELVDYIELSEYKYLPKSKCDKMKL